MQKFNIQAKQRKKRFVKNDDKNFEALNIPNLIKEVKANHPNQILASDFTYFNFKWYQFYLWTVIDQFTKQIISSQVSFKHNKEFVIQTVTWAINNLNKWNNINYINNNNKYQIIIHSDQWSEYRSYDYQKLLNKNNIQISMSKKSSPWENWYQESFYWKFKQELWSLNRFNSIEEAIEAIYRQIYYYNNDRIHTALKMSPNKFAEMYKKQKKMIETNV